MSRNATLLLIRHAEDTGRKDDRGLSAAGLCGAWAYVPWFRSRRGLAPPSILIAAADEADSMRQRQTLEPLAAVQGIRLEARFDEKRYRELARLVSRQERFDGVVTVVCWRHDELLPLAQALGAQRDALPATWSEEEYGWIIRLDFAAEGTCSTHIASQRLMHADRRVPRARNPMARQGRG